MLADSQKCINDVLAGVTGGTKDCNLHVVEGWVQRS
jgi:hypothetical protein